MGPYATIAVELVIGFGALFLYMRILGKAHFSKLTPFDFVSVLMLGELLGNAVYDKHVHIGHVLYATALWGSLIWLIVTITTKFNASRKPMEGEPTVIIRNGKLLYEAMKTCRLDLNELQTMLRQTGYFSMDFVEFAVLETNGNLSVMPKSRYDKPTRTELGLPERQVAMPVSLILDGEVIRDNFKEAGVDEAWLRERLSERGIASYDEVFFAEWHGDDALYVATYNESKRL